MSERSTSVCDGARLTVLSLQRLTAHRRQIAPLLATLDHATAASAACQIRSAHAGDRGGEQADDTAGPLHVRIDRPDATDLLLGVGSAEPDVNRSGSDLVYRQRVLWWADVSSCRLHSGVVQKMIFAAST